MSVSAAQAAAFVSEASEAGTVWAVRDEGGYPAPKNADGNRAMPFWSKRSRAEKIIGSVPAFAGFEPVEISLQDFLETWLPNLEKDGLSVGLNWYGNRATGYHLSPQNVQAKFGLLKVTPREVVEPIAETRLSKFVGWIASKASTR